MRKAINLFIFSSILITHFGCSDAELFLPAPSGVTLIYPSQNLLCIENVITFDWTSSIGTEDTTLSYDIVVATNRDLTNVVANQTVNESQVTITLERAVAYYWRVTPIFNSGSPGTPSPVYAFYTSGEAVANAVPFTAELVAPSHNSSVSSGLISLMWIGADSDIQDTLQYDIFFGEDSDPGMVESGWANQSYDVTVESGKTYYWKINTIDNSGDKSIGQVWTFTVN